MTYTLDGGGIRVEIDLADGARLTSLAALGRQWLAESGARTPGDYLQRGSGGWDEIAPTISAGALADGSVLADHGDAWQTAWTAVSADDSHVEASVTLASVPITLSRRVDATAEGLRLSYSATTPSVVPVPLYWCAHPLFVAHPGTLLRADGDPPLVEEYPRRGVTRAWPRETKPAAIKAFTASPVAQASIVHANGDTLTLAWDPALLPYLGLYWDGAEFTSTPVVAIEPSTGFGDSAARAEAEGRVRPICARTPFEWWLTVTVARTG